MIETLNWEPLFVMDLNVGYDRPQHFGSTPLGHRAIYPVDGGTFVGNRLRGLVNGDGADWITIRSDGVMMIDVRLGLTTDDGARIGMTYTGLARANSSEGKDPSGTRITPGYEATYFHTTPRFETGDPRYFWLNETIAVAKGVRSTTGGRYHVFAIV